jgi:hypothetical protein
MRHGYETGRTTDERPSGIRTRDDFAEYPLRVLEDYRETGASVWENNTLEPFIDGLSAFALARVHDQPGQEDASWQLPAEIIAAATGYE